MGGVVDALEDAIGSAIDAVVDIAEVVWDDVIVPALEEIFSWFGITDETVVQTQKTSSLIYGSEENLARDEIHDANVKAVMSMVVDGGSFFPWYMKYTRQTYGQLKAFYRYAEQERYVYGLPSMEIKGTIADYNAIDIALDDAVGVACTRLDSRALFPDDDVYFKHKWQATPYFYKPWNNTLTHTDPYSVSWDDYTLGSIVYLPGTDEFELSVSRVAEEALFWIEGPPHVVEGDSATYVIKCNRTVPVGESIDIDLAYTGTAPGVDYTPVASVTMLASTDEISFVVATTENVAVDGARTVIVTVDSITNTNAAFEAVGIHTLDSITTTITDDEGIILTMPSVLVTESAGTVSIPVKLEAVTAGGAFTVDFVTSDGTAIGGGVDFDSTGGTLNFNGTPAGETRYANIAITTPDGDDDNEYFTVSLTNCSDGTVDISQTCTVRISDDTDVTPVPGTVLLTDVVTEPGYIKERSLVVEYHVTADPATEWFYWIYKFSDGTYPDIDPNTSILSNLDMLPVGIIRQDKVNTNTDKESEAYRSTKRLLDMLFLDINDITDNIMENPGIDDVDDVFVNFAINPTSTVEVISKALYLSYYQMIVTYSVVSNTNEYSASFSEQDIQCAVVWNEHSYTADISGTLASGQEYEHEIVEVPEIIEEGEVTQEAGSILKIRHQTAPGLYDELKVHNLNGMASIAYAGYSKVAFNRIGDDSFTIPLSFFILSMLDPIEQMELYKHILRLDLYSIQIIELEWYQTSEFLTLFKFAALAITIWTAGAAGGLWAVVQQLIINYLVIELVMYLAEATGNAEFAAIVGLVAMIALGSAGGVPPFDFATAEGLINASTLFANNLTAGYNTLGQQLGQDMVDLNARAEERLKDINDATPEESAITSEFLVALQSVDATVFPAVAAQYDFDLLYNYDRIIKDYYDMNLMIGVN